MEDSDEYQLMEEIESQSKINISTENSLFLTEDNVNDYLIEKFTDYNLPQKKSKKRVSGSDYKSSHKKRKLSEDPEKDKTTPNCPTKRKKHSKSSKKHKKEKCVKNNCFNINWNLQNKSLSQEDKIIASDKEKFSEEDGTQNWVIKRKKRSKKHKQDKFVKKADFNAESNLKNKTLLPQEDAVTTYDCENQNVLKSSHKKKKNCEDAEEDETQNCKKNAKRKKHSKKSTIEINTMKVSVNLKHKTEKSDKNNYYNANGILKNKTLLLKEDKITTHDCKKQNILKNSHKKKNNCNYAEEVNKKGKKHKRDNEITTSANEKQISNQFLEDSEQEDFHIVFLHGKKTQEKQISDTVELKNSIAVKKHKKKKKHSKKLSKEKVNVDCQDVNRETQILLIQNDDSNKNDENSNNFNIAMYNSSISQVENIENEIKLEEKNNLNAVKYDDINNDPLKNRLKHRTKKLFNLDTYCNIDIQRSTKPSQPPNFLSISVENNSASSSEINNSNNLDHKNLELPKYNSNFDLSTSNKDIKQLPSPKVGVNSAVKDKGFQITKINKKVDCNQSDGSSFADNELLKANKKIFEQSQLSQPLSSPSLFDEEACFAELDNEMSRSSSCESLKASKKILEQSHMSQTCSSPSLFDDEACFAELDNATSSLSSCKLEIQHFRQIKTLNRTHDESLLKSRIYESDSLAVNEHHCNKDSTNSSVHEQRLSEIVDVIPSTFYRSSPATDIPQLFIPAECSSESDTKINSEHIDSPSSNLEEYVPNSQMSSEYFSPAMLGDIFKSSLRTSSIDVNRESSISASLQSENNKIYYSEVNSVNSLFDSDISLLPFSKSPRKHCQASDPTLDDSQCGVKILTLESPPASNVNVNEHQDYVLENIIKTKSQFETENIQNYTNLDVQDDSSCTNSSKIRISEGSLQITSTGNPLHKYTSEVLHYDMPSPLIQSDYTTSEMPVSTNTNNTAGNYNFKKNVCTQTEFYNAYNCVVDCKINDSNINNLYNARSISSVEVIINLNGDLSAVNANQVIAKFDFQSETGSFQFHRQSNIYASHANPHLGLSNESNASAPNKSSPCIATSNTSPGSMNLNSNGIHNITSTDGPQQCLYANPDNAPGVSGYLERVSKVTTKKYQENSPEPIKSSYLQKPASRKLSKSKIGLKSTINSETDRGINASTGILNNSITTDASNNIENTIEIIPRTNENGKKTEGNDNGKEDFLEVREFLGKGRGVVTTKSIKRGELVLEYPGELVTFKEAAKRETEYANHDDAGSFLYYFKFNGNKFCIDATKDCGRLGCLVNHSKKGNLNPKIIITNLRPHIVFFAACDIEAQTELLYDYGDRRKIALRHHPWLST